MMEWIQQLAENPIVLAGVLVLLVILVYGLLKRLFKLALFVGLVAVAVLLWFHFTGREVPGDLDEMARQAGQVAREAVQQGGEMIEKGGELLKKLEKDGD